ncbi:MAG TPA: hypothetical protein VKS81_03380 [Bacteroidota bacterium]|nr:hypothetical protein [Bacteroidota bacterium]
MNHIPRTNGAYRRRPEFTSAFRRIASLLPALLLLASLLSGCGSSSDDTSDYESDFFVPVDTVKANGTMKDQGTVMLNGTPGFTGSQNPTNNAAGGEEWAPLYTSRDEVFTSPERMPTRVLRDSLSIITEQIALLQNVLEASTIDPKMYFHSQVKAWRITNPVVRDSLFYTLMAVDSSMQSEAGTDAEVLATETNDLIEVRFGTSVFKGMTLKSALQKSPDPFLLQKVIESSAYSKDVELRDTSFHLPTPFAPELVSLDTLNDRFVNAKYYSATTPHGSVDISLYGLSARIGPNWGAEMKIGNDEIGLPFWASGKTAFLATYKTFKAGFELPMTAGLHGGATFPLFSVRERLLNGTSGIVGMFDAGSVGGYYSATRLTSNDLGSLTNPSSFYSISQILQAWFSFGFSVNAENYFRIKLGGGYDQMQHSMLNPPNSTGAIVQLGENTYNSYYVKIDYLHSVAEGSYGASFQFFDFTLLTTAWLEVIPHVLTINIKYERIVSRDLRPWETSDFIILSPIFHWEF